MYCTVLSSVILIVEGYINSNGYCRVTGVLYSVILIVEGYINSNGYCRVTGVLYCTQ